MSGVTERSEVMRTAKRIRRQLGGSVRYEVNSLAADIDAAATTITLTFPLANNFKEGAVLDVEGELMRVMSINAGAQTAVVLRNWLDSEPVTHLTGEEVAVDARFPLANIIDEMISELRSWTPRLYRVTELEAAITVSPDIPYRVYTLPDTWDLLRVIRISRNQTSDYYTPITDDTWPEVQFRLQRGDITRVRFLGSDVWTGNLFIQAAIGFDTTTFDPTTDLLTDVGLVESMLDVLELGTKCRLLADQEHVRSSRQAQGEPRTAQEVPPGTAATGAQRLYAMYVRRRGEEAARLNRLYPMSFNGS